MAAIHMMILYLYWMPPLEIFKKCGSDAGNITRKQLTIASPTRSIVSKTLFSLFTTVS